MSDLEIYVHIPFCVRKCAYCDFLSGPADEDAKARYLTGLFDEFRFYAEKLKSAETRKTVTTVFVGGGTPSSLSAGQLDSLLEKLHTSFKIGKEAEVTVECNPGTLSAEKLWGVVKFFSSESSCR